MPTPLRPPVPPSIFTEKEARRIVVERSLGMCEIAIAGLCEGRGAGVHHRIKRGQGGPWAAANLLHACGSGTTGCHGWAELHPTQANELGVSLWSTQDYLEVPVVMRWMNEVSTWLLDNEGMLTWVPSERAPVLLAMAEQARSTPSTGPEWSARRLEGFSGGRPTLSP
jgi:hypothetical protein